MRCSSIRLASSTILVALQHHNIIYRNRTVNAPGAEGFKFANELILATLTHSQGSIRRWGRRLRLHSVSIHLTKLRIELCVFSFSIQLFLPSMARKNAKLPRPKSKGPSIFKSVT